MTQLIIHKDKMQEALMRFLSTIQTDEIRLEFDDKHFYAEPVQGKSVLDILAEQAEDMGPEDLSLNVDHYLYGLSKRSEK
jgi:antitoxin component of MazEF toxin-antitoxin module